jgi:hypothetical protein
MTLERRGPFRDMNGGGLPAPSVARPLGLQAPRAPA